MSGQFGFAKETAWATPAAIDTFVPVLEASHTIDEGLMTPAGIRAGRVTESPGQLGARKVSGRCRLEVPNLPFKELLEQMCGTLGTAGAGPYTHTATPSAPSTSLTLQAGVTNASDTTEPFTAWGAKMSSWELSLAVGAYAILAFDWTAQDITVHRSVSDAATTNGDATLTSATAAFTAGDVGKPVSGTGIPAGTTIASVTNATTVELSAAATATAAGVTVNIGIALAAASYAAGLAPFTFVHGALTIAGNEVASARNCTLRVAKNLKVDRHRLGSRFPREQRPDGKWMITGTIQGDFDDLTTYRAAARAGELALSLDLDNGIDSLDVDCNIQILGDPPSLTRIGLEDQTINFKAVGDTDAETLTAVLVNTES